VRQRKTGRPVRFELTEHTRQAVDDYLKATGKVPGEFLFTKLVRVDDVSGRQDDAEKPRARPPNIRTTPNTTPHHYTFVLIAADFDPKDIPPGLTRDEVIAKFGPPPTHVKGVAGLVKLFVNPWHN
jgi:hypothetical protein